MQTWQRANHDGTRTPASGNVIKIGKGKGAVPVFGIASYPTRNDAKAYQIDHIPSGALVVRDLIFLSLAREVCNDLTNTLATCDLTLGSAEELAARFPRSLVLYLEWLRFKDLKKCNFEEWKNGPDYLQELERDRTFMAGKHGPEHPAEFYDGDASVAWFPDDTGTMRGDDLKLIIKGHPINGD